MAEDEKAPRPWPDVRADFDAARGEAFAGVNLKDRRAVEEARKRLVASHPELFAEMKAMSDADARLLMEGHRDLQALLDTLDDHD